MDRAAAKTAAILDAALRLFAAQGIQGTPTAAIAKAAGVSNGTLFHYFPTKDALIVGLYRHCKQQLAAASPPLPPDAPVPARLEAIVRRTVRWALAQPEAFQFLRTMNQPPFVHLLPPDDLAQGLALHQDLLRQGQAAGVVVAGPVPLLYAMVSAQVDALVTVLRDAPADADTVLDFGWQRLWALLAAPAST